MPVQHNEWSCSVYSYAWVIGATGVDPGITYDQALQIIGYPDCVNPTYGLMLSQCMINAFSHYGLHAVEYWSTFDEAYSICSQQTGVINPTGMYHFMGIRGVDGQEQGDIWCANSAPGYRGIYDSLTRSSFNNLGPTKLIVLD